jgi:hypothetical protein
MATGRRERLHTLPAMRTKILVAASVAVLALGGVAIAQIASGVPNAQPRVDSPPNVIANGFSLVPLVQGVDPIENPVGLYQTYGFLNDHASQASGLDTKTEPDQNTYLVTKSNPGGPTPHYDYGRHFLIQGHEVFAGSHAYLTRINLDVKDTAHRITLLNAPGADGNSGLTSIDGSTYDPFAKRLLFTAEASANGGVVATPFTWSSKNIPPLTHLDGSFGKAGYEGIHSDDHGNLYIIEDVGGSTVPDNGNTTLVKQPNSFIYRFKPSSPGNLGHGKLQALQVEVDGTPITFHPGASDPQGQHEDAFGEPIRRLHSGEKLKARWVTLHDTTVDGTDPFDANAAAKAKGATPFKRPENGKFVPDTDFRSFVFDETGDTNNDAGNYPGAAERGAWGALLRLDMPFVGADTGKVRTIVNGDAEHASFDNVAFLDKNTLLVAEDRGDTLHQQLNTLDSLWSFDLRKSLGSITSSAKRLEAQGRDVLAMADANDHGATPPVTNQNDGDNEVTGIHVSDGSTSSKDILGAEDPADLKGVRIFVTQQHGANITFEIVPKKHDR